MASGSIPTISAIPAEAGVAEALVKVEERVAAAYDAWEDAEGQVVVAQARLRAALEAAEAYPRVSPSIARLTSAQHEAHRTREAAETAAARVRSAQRELEDAAGQLDAARARFDDLTQADAAASDGEPSRATVGTTVGATVEAEVEVERLTRAMEAARATVIDAEEDAAAAEGEAAAAEDHVVAAAQEARNSETSRTSDRSGSAGLDGPGGAALGAGDPVPVVTARVALAKAKRAAAAAERALARAQDLAAREREDLLSAAGSGTNGSSDAPGDGQGGGEEEPPAPEFASLDAFVHQYVLPNWQHRQTGTRWCATWWRHPEAVTRLEALWEAFEVMRREPAPALSSLWIYHLDPHMRALTDPDGTFASCKVTAHEQTHQQQPVWGATPPPQGLFEIDPRSPRQPLPTAPAAPTAPSWPVSDVVMEA